MDKLGVDLRRRTSQLGAKENTTRTKCEVRFSFCLEESMSSNQRGNIWSRFDEDEAVGSKREGQKAEV